MGILFNYAKVFVVIGIVGIKSGGLNIQAGRDEFVYFACQRGIVVKIGDYEIGSSPI